MLFSIESIKMCMELSNLMYPDPTVPLSNVIVYTCSQETDSASKWEERKSETTYMEVTMYQLVFAKIMLHNMHPLKQYLNNPNNLSRRMC